MQPLTNQLLIHPWSSKWHWSQTRSQRCSALPQPVLAVPQLQYSCLVESQWELQCGNQGIRIMFWKGRLSHCSAMQWHNGLCTACRWSENSTLTPIIIQNVDSGCVSWACSNLQVSSCLGNAQWPIEGLCTLKHTVIGYRNGYTSCCWSSLESSCVSSTSEILSIYIQCHK